MNNIAAINGPLSGIRILDLTHVAGEPVNYPDF